MKTSTSGYPRALTLTAVNLFTAAGALAGSDFNGDGVQDLAIGVPNESVGNSAQAGMVQVFYGSVSNGIQFTNPADQVFHQDSPGVNQTAEALDHFGAVLATGDFDGDSFDDLAIGTPDEDISTNGGVRTDSGVVNILYGSPSGLTASGDHDFLQGDEGLADTIETGDRFGRVLAVGDFDGDGYDDLAIGIPDEDVGNISNAGAVQILFGSDAGLSGDRDIITHQDRSGILDSCEGNDSFGFALAAADLGNDGRDDLAIGVPFEDVVINGINLQNCGMVQVLYGTETGLTTIDQVWNQGAGGLLGSTDINEAFGLTLAAGNRRAMNGFPARAFLAIGVRSDNDSPADSGSVVVLRANMTTDRLVSTDNQLITLDLISGFTPPAETDDFGATLVISDFGKNPLIVDPGLDLAIAAPGAAVTASEGGPPVAGAGCVFVVYDVGSEIDPNRVERFAQGALGGLPDAPEIDDRFGSALAAGNFGRNTFPDLAIGVAGEDTNLSNVGAVHIVHSAGTAGLEPANNQFFTQNTANVEDQAEAGDGFGSSLGR